MSFFRFHSLWLGLAGVALAQTVAAQTAAPTGTWSLPADGYLYDQLNRSIRPVAGFTGSAVLGPPTLSQVDWVSIAPNQKSAIVQQGRSLVWIADLTSPNQTQPLDRLPVARMAFWAADSSRVVILTADSQLIWLTHFDSSPGLQASWQLTDFAPAGVRGHWNLLAADSAADEVLLSEPTAAGPALWTASSLIAPASIALPVQPSAAVFAASSSTAGMPIAYVADAAAQQIVRIQGLDGTPSMTPLVSSGVYVSDPAGLALSSSGGQLFLVNHSSATVYEFDSSSGALLLQMQAEESPRSLQAVSPTRFLFEPAEANSADPSSRPVLLLDTSQPARVLFIPRGQ